MLQVSKTTWKRVMEGLGRGDVGPFVQDNTIPDVRRYFDGGELVMRMTTGEDSQKFEVRQDLITKTEYIYIPTDEEYEEWEELEFIENRDIASEKIAEKEGREYVPPVRS